MQGIFHMLAHLILILSLKEPCDVGIILTRLGVRKLKVGDFC